MIFLNFNLSKFFTFYQLNNKFTFTNKTFDIYFIYYFLYF